MEGPAVAFEAALCELTDLIELQDLAFTATAPAEEFDVATIVDAAGERVWPSGSTRLLARTGRSPCLAWGQPELVVRAVGVVLADVAARSPKANALAADVQSARDAGRAVVKVVVRALGDDLPLCDLGKIGWDALLTRRRGVLAAGLGLVRRWLRIQGGSLGARQASDGSVEFTIEVPASRDAP
jgi:hypothetical protein